MAARDKQRGKKQVEEPGSFGRWAWEWAKSIAVAFVLFLVVRTFVVEAFQIPTGSMENTLLVGDFLLVNKMVYGAEIPGTSVRLPAIDPPEHGDIVVFEPPPRARQAENTNYKSTIRLAALPSPGGERAAVAGVPADQGQLGSDRGLAGQLVRHGRQ